MFVKPIKEAPSIKTQIIQPALQVVDKIKNKISSIRAEVCITLENYNKLLAGEAVDGYGSYKEDTVYRIIKNENEKKFRISTVDSNKKIREVIFGKIANNTDGSLPENTETSATFLSTETPSLGIRYYKPVIGEGQNLEVQYYVDTKRGDRVYKNIVEDTFTVIIKDEHDKVLYKQTTYAGEFVATINFGEISGETWFSIQAIDNHGVGSATQFFDVLIKNAPKQNVYVMKETDLLKFNIQPNVQDSIVGYKNKIGLTNLFAWAKQYGYNEIKMWNPDGNTIYYIDYRLNLSTTPGEVDLGHSQYYVYTVQNEQITDTVELVPGEQITLNNKNYTVGLDVVDWIIKDGAKLYRDANNKIQVFWSGYSYDRTTEKTNTSRYLRTYRLSYFNELVEVEINGTKVKKPRYQTLGDGQYYVLTSTVPYLYAKGFTGGDQIKFPNEFTVNLNKATIQALPCYEIRLGGVIVGLDLNFDTHVRNGKLVGMYKNYNFKRCFISEGLSMSSTPVEHVKVTEVTSSKYCSLEDLEISYSTGYEGSVGMSDHVSFIGKYSNRDNTSKFDKNNPDTCTYPLLRFNKLGYIDYQGNIKSEDLVEYLRGDSPDREIADTISIVYTNTFTPCHPKVKFSDGTIKETNEISIEPGGYKSFASGKQHEFFIHFYDSSFKFIKTVKSSMYYMIKVPKNTLYIKLSAYGLSQVQRGARVPVLDDYGRCKSLQHIDERVWCLAKNNWFKNCYWHDTRTIAVHMAYAKGHLWENCNYVKIAIEPRGDWSVTKIFGDFEEGWATIDMAAFIGCTGERKQYSDLGELGQRLIAINCVRNFSFYNNDGIGVEERGGFESGLYYNSHLPKLRITRRGTQERPIVVYKDLSIDEELWFSYVNDTRTRIYAAIGQRYNRCDDDVINTVTFRDSHVKTPIYGTGGTEIIVEEHTTNK